MHNITLTNNNYPRDAKYKYMRSIITPEYIKNFSCIADKCEDHCCHSWDISIDKSTYKFMTQKSLLKVKSADVICELRGMNLLIMQKLVLIVTAFALSVKKVGYVK